MESPAERRRPELSIEDFGCLHTRMCISQAEHSSGYTRAVGCLGLKEFKQL